jgi:hypothetical protein
MACRSVGSWQETPFLVAWTALGQDFLEHGSISITSGGFSMQSKDLEVFNNMLLG